MIAYTVQPYNLPKIRQEHFTGIFGDFRAVVTQRIDELRHARHPLARHRMAFFEFLLRETDAEHYAEIQRTFLHPSRLDPESDVAKYLDPIIWFESKIALAVRLELDRGPPKRILDLGTGPGHFAVVARFFGHEVLGTELPLRSRGMGETDHLYDALCDVFAVNRLSHKIVPFGNLADLPGGFDLVTALLAAFNVDEQKKPWKVEHWKCFMRGLREHVLSPHGAVFFNLANNKVTSETWAYLARQATWATETNKSVYFTQLTSFAEADRPGAL